MDKLRLSATRSLFERRDCVIVASVSCIYGLGSPEAYYGMLLMLEKGQRISRKEILAKLVEILYERNDADFRRGTFRVRGDVIEIYPTYDDMAIRIELWGDEVDALSKVDPLLGEVKETFLRLPIYPKSHYVMSPPTRQMAMASIEKELHQRHAELEKMGKLIEAQRLWQRTMFDLEMMKEIGYCHGIENYSRHFSGRAPGEPPPTLLDYLPVTHCCSWTKAIRRCRSCGACTTVTVPARRIWCPTGFGFPAPWITARCDLKSSRQGYTNCFTFRRHRGPMNWRKHKGWWWSRSSGLQAGGSGGGSATHQRAGGRPVA